MYTLCSGESTSSLPPTNVAQAEKKISIES